MSEPPTVSVAFQGVLGAYGEIACHQCAQAIHATAEPVGLRSFHDVFQAVHSGQTELGVVPVENSLAGSILTNFDLLLEHQLHIAREVVVRVSHCLLALPGVQLNDLKIVRSHPQALAQCDGFLAKHKLQPIEAFDTAGSALELRERGARNEAVIASRRAAELYGLEVLREGIEDESFNFTRFFVLSKNAPQHQANEPSKTSLVFAVKHTPGALVDALTCLEGLNMTKIESRPRRDRAWSYMFFVDFEGHSSQTNVAQAIGKLEQKAAFLRVLGSYPTAFELRP